MNKHIIAAGLAAVTLAVPAAAAAKPQGHGEDHGRRPATEHAKKVKQVMFVFRGTFTAPGTVQVLAGNAHARKGGFVGQAVTFDFTRARVIAADANADGQRDVADVHDGDLVLVQARLAKGTKFDAAADALVARKLIDRTSPPVADATPETSG